MDWFPVLEIGILNGWLHFGFYLVVFIITLSTCPKEVKKRLFDRSLWNRNTKIITVIGKSFSFLNIFMIIFGKLAIGTTEFMIGTILYLCGLTLLVVGIINFRSAPLNEPILNGLYKISRNPQMIALYLMFLGMILAIGSGISLVFLTISILCSHFSILGEENSLKQQYGESYIDFTKKVPRYFLFV